MKMTSPLYEETTTSAALIRTVMVTIAVAQMSPVWCLSERSVETNNLGQRVRICEVFVEEGGGS